MKKKKFIKGTSYRPRVSVFRSLKHISVQAIDDVENKVLCNLSSSQKEVRAKLKKTGNKEASAYVGKIFGEKLKKKNVNRIIFDRNGFLYHGNIKVLADSIREVGIKF